MKRYPSSPSSPRAAPRSAKGSNSNGTPKRAESIDGDGTNDGAEVAQGSIPTDASDDGLPPSADEICELKLTVGDWSDSDSERYDLKVGPITHQAPQFGVVTSGNYNQFGPGAGRSKIIGSQIGTAS